MDSLEVIDKKEFTYPLVSASVAPPLPVHAPGDSERTF